MRACTPPNAHHRRESCSLCTCEECDNRFRVVQRIPEGAQPCQPEKLLMRFQTSILHAYLEVDVALHEFAEKSQAFFLGVAEERVDAVEALLI